MQTKLPDMPDNNSLAMDRTTLANERTYQAWLRTSLAALVSGLGIYKFMSDMMSLWVLLAIVTLLILLRNEGLIMPESMTQDFGFTGML